MSSLVGGTGSALTRQRILLGGGVLPVSSIFYLEAKKCTRQGSEGIVGVKWCSSSVMLRVWGRRGEVGACKKHKTFNGTRGKETAGLSRKKGLLWGEKKKKKGMSFPLEGGGGKSKRGSISFMKNIVKTNFSRKQLMGGRQKRAKEMKTKTTLKKTTEGADTGAEGKTSERRSHVGWGGVWFTNAGKQWGKKEVSSRAL